jgi:hypothetical protein
MKKIIAALLLFSATAAYAATAYWTGRSEFVTTVTYQQGIKCEYDYFGNKFWKTFVRQSSCPSSVEVE